jgi:hypothetical protein
MIYGTIPSKDWDWPGALFMILVLITSTGDPTITALRPAPKAHRT